MSHTHYSLGRRRCSHVGCCCCYTGMGRPQLRRHPSGERGQQPHPSTNAHGRARPRLKLELTDALSRPFAAVAPDAAVLRRSPAILPASRTYDLARAWSRQQSPPSSPDSQWHSECSSVAASFDLDVATLLVARRTLRCPQPLVLNCTTSDGSLDR
jgi:hypothetical protein